MLQGRYPTGNFAPTPDILCPNNSDFRRAPTFQAQTFQAHVRRQSRIHARPRSFVHIGYTRRDISGPTAALGRTSQYSFDGSSSIVYRFVECRPAVGARATVTGIEIRVYKVVYCNSNPLYYFLLQFYFGV